MDLVGGFDAFVTLTDRQRQDIAQRRGRTSNLFVVPNPVDMPPEPDEPPVRDPRLVSVVARLEGQKRLSHAIAAFKHVVEKVPDARLEIWGSGSRAEGLQRAIDRRGLQDSVTMMGHHPRARDALWRSSALVMTSLFEGYPLSTLESMSHGCPVVSYDIKYGPQEQITDGVDGFLVPSGATRVMADRLVTLLKDPALVARMSEAAREKARQHGYERFVSDWASVLHAAVELKTKRTKLERVSLTVSDLGVRGTGLARLRGGTVPTAMRPTATLRLRATLAVTGRSKGSDLSEARVELAAVHEGSGAVVDVPVTATRTEGGFSVAADVPLGALYPEGAADDASSQAHLRLRLVWQNSAWETVVRRPPGRTGTVELSYLPDDTLRLLRR
jgi:poly(glycerol-phosphate) alpha-glucosyltransferase